MTFCVQQASYHICLSVSISFTQSYHTVPIKLTSVQRQVREMICNYILSSCSVKRKMYLGEIITVHLTTKIAHPSWTNYTAFNNNNVISCRLGLCSFENGYCTSTSRYFHHNYCIYCYAINLHTVKTDNFKTYNIL